MSRQCDPIKKLNDSKPLWKIGVRIVDLWYVQKDPKQRHLEMIVMDEMGDKIQVGVKNKEFVEWSSKLKEHSTYFMQNFAVVTNYAKLKTCDHAYKMYFTECTTLKEIDIPVVPLFQYNFKNFSDINSGNFRKEYLVDIIGVVHQVTNTHPAGKLQKAVMTLKDTSGDVVQCTLWEELAMQFISYMKQTNDPTLTTIIILTKAKINEAQGNFPAEVSNSWSGSKLLINEDIADMKKFKASFVPTETQQSSSQMVSQISGTSQFSGSSEFSEQEKFLYKAQVKSIFEITNHIKKEVPHIVTVGTTVMLIPNKNGWYYEGCSSCTRRAEAANGPFTCGGMHYSEKSVPRYKLDIKVVHKKGSGKFVFWDQDCTEIIGQTALCLRDAMLAEGEDSPKAYPKDLDKMLYRTVALRVRVNPTYSNSSVQRLSENPTIIKAILDQLPPDEGTSKVDKVVSNVEESVQFDTGTSKVDKVVSNVEESVQFDTSLSGIADHDPEISTSMTPAKRISLNNAEAEEQSPNVGSAKNSTTKLTKHIKKE